jgi:hypothetical protein
MKFNYKEWLKALKIPKISIKIPHIDTEKKEIVVRESCLIAGFLLIAAGLWGYDWRISCIVCGYSLVKFSGLIKKVV